MGTTARSTTARNSTARATKTPAPRSVRAAANGPEDEGDRIVGRVLSDRYRLESILGEGATSRVFRASDLALRRPVAIKVLRCEGAPDDRAIRRFLHGARTGALLRHPNSVRVHDFGVSPDGHAYAVLELLEGRPLDRVLAEDGPLPPERAISVAAQVARALQEAHAFGLVHRDLKPANVFLTWPYGETACAKVLDFGLAGSCESAGGQTAPQRRPGVMCGTPHYVAPEQALGDPVDGRADLYSLGVLLFEMVTAAQPFQGATVREVISRRLHETAPPLPDVVCGRPIPASLRALTAALLERRPVDRPATAGEVVARLVAVDPRRSVRTPAPTLLFGGDPAPTVELPGARPARLPGDGEADAERASTARPAPGARRPSGRGLPLTPWWTVEDFASGVADLGGGRLLRLAALAVLSAMAFGAAAALLVG